MRDSAGKWCTVVNEIMLGLEGAFFFIYFFYNSQKGIIVRAIIQGVHGVRAFHSVRTFRGVKALHPICSYI